MKKLPKFGIRGKILLTVSFSLVFFFLLESLILQSIFGKSFVEQEKSSAVEDIQRVEALIKDETDKLRIKITDWSVWDDSYNFVLKPSQDFISTNISPDTIKSLDINYIIFISSANSVVYSEGADRQTGKAAQVPQSLLDYILSNKELTTHRNEKDIKSGIMPMGDKYLMFASAPVVKSTGGGPIAGTVIFAKIIDENLFKHLSKLNNSELIFSYYNSDFLTEEIQKVKTEMPNGLRLKEADGEEDLYVVSNLSEQQLAVYTIIYDYKDDPAFIVKDTLPRTFYSLGTSAINLFLIINITIASVGIVFAYFLLNLIVISKISKLNKDLDEVTDPNNKKNRLEFSGNDEFTNLATNINKMLDAISKSAKDLEKFKFVIEGSSDHVIITDPDGKIVFANKRAEIMTGYTKNEMMGKTPALWGRQMPKEFYEKMWDTIKNKKEPFSGEVVNKNRYGQLYPVEASITPILDEYRNVIYFVGIERDISTEKKLAQQLAKEKQEIEQQVRERTRELSTAQIQLKASISSLALGFIMTDANNNILFINQAARNILCASTDSPLRTVADCTLGHIEDELKGAIDLRSLIKETISSKKPTLVKEIPFERRYLKFYITPIAELADVIGTVVLIDDITERKIIERSKDEFFSIASHELRTPLTAIRGNTSMIKDYYSEEIKNPELKTMIEDINESSKRLIQIVNDFLDTSRLELGKIVFKKDSIDIVELINSVVKELGASGEQKNLYLRFNPPKDVLVPHVLGDKDRIRQILVNLVGNGLKYTEQGGLNISLDKENKLIKILVTDTGKGISPENQKLLFRKFQQAGENIYTRDFSQSTGLGLYISKLMAQGMGGEVEIINSELGKGSTFALIMPIDESWIKNEN